VLPSLLDPEIKAERISESSDGYAGTPSTILFRAAHEATGLIRPHR